MPVAHWMVSDIISDIIKLYSDLLNRLFGPIIGDFLTDPVGNFVQLITDF